MADDTLTGAALVEAGARRTRRQLRADRGCLTSSVCFADPCDCAERAARGVLRAAVAAAGVDAEGLDWLASVQTLVTRHERSVAGARLLRALAEVVRDE